MYGAEETVGEQWTALVGVEEVVVVLSCITIGGSIARALSLEEIDVGQHEVLREVALRGVGDATRGAIVEVVGIVDDADRVAGKTLGHVAHLLELLHYPTLRERVDVNIARSIAELLHVGRGE